MAVKMNVFKIAFVGGSEGPKIVKDVDPGIQGGIVIAKHAKHFFQCAAGNQKIDHYPLDPGYTFYPVVTVIEQSSYDSFAIVQWFFLKFSLENFLRSPISQVAAYGNSFALINE